MSPQKIIGIFLAGYLGVIGYVTVNKQQQVPTAPAIEHVLEVPKTKPESQVNPTPVELLPIKPLEVVEEAVEEPVEEKPKTSIVQKVKKIFKKKKPEPEEIQETKVVKEPKPVKVSILSKPILSEKTKKFLSTAKKCDNDYKRNNSAECKWVRDVFEEHGTWKKVYQEKYGPE